MTLYDLQQEFLYYCGSLINGFDLINNLGTMNMMCYVPLIIGVFGIIFSIVYFNNANPEYDALKRVEYDAYKEMCMEKNEKCLSINEFTFKGGEKYNTKSYIAMICGFISMGLIIWGGYQYSQCSSQKDTWLDKLKSVPIPPKFNGMPRSGYDLYMDMTQQEQLENMAKNNLRNMNNRNNMLPHSGLNISLNL